MASAAETVHAAKEHGASVTGVTIPREQLAFGRARVRTEGLGHLVELRLQDYRDIPLPVDGGYDVTWIEMGEHVGADNHPRFFDHAARPAARGRAA